MRISYFLFLFPLFPSIFSSTLQTKKICADCRNFIGNEKKCRAFGDIDITTGKPNYEMASDVRKDDKKCGISAKYFETNDLKIITVPKYYIIENWSNLFIISLLVTYTILLIKNYP